MREPSDAGVSRRAAFLGGVAVFAAGVAAAVGVDRFVAGRPPAGVPQDDPGRLVRPSGDGRRRVLPLLAARGLDVRRPGVLGWSIGGYGALYLGTRLGPARIAAVVAESPALWQHSWHSAAHAFDDAADFDAHAVVGRERLLAGIPLRIDCGAADGFAPITRVLRSRRTPVPAGGIEPGGHDDAYWRSQAAAQLLFVAGHLAA